MPEAAALPRLSRWAGEADRAALEGFLRDHADCAMFPLANLRRHGLHGGPGPYACRYWLSFAEGRLAGVTGLSSGGVLLPVGAPDPGELARCLAGRGIGGILGETCLARSLQERLGLEAVPCQMSADEPHFALDLEWLTLPATDGLCLVPPSEAPAATVLRWRADYLAGMHGIGDAAALARAETEMPQMLAADTHRMLLRAGRPAAMTGFNARLPEIVQVGGVYTPPELRGQGLARAAVALHLAEARAAGICRAVLFAASEPAARAYAAIGFGRIGRYTLALFDGRHEVRSCP